LKKNDLKNIHIAISGAGKVGGKLAKLLHKEGAKLSIANIDQSQLNDLSNDVKFSRVSPDEIIGLECDLLSPCALGNVIHEKNINSLNCKMIVGGANNQLGNESIGLNLKNNNVVYSPDFLVNSGGVIAISCEINKNEKNLENQLNTIGKRTTEILEISQKINKATNTVAKNLAWERINNSG
jgi:leucine dehydrogenase